jgi:hypothetical protein
VTRKWVSVICVSVLWVQEQVTRNGIMTAMEISGSWNPGRGSGFWSGSIGQYS